MLLHIVTSAKAFLKPCLGSQVPSYGNLTVTPDKLCSGWWPSLHLIPTLAIPSLKCFQISSVSEPFVKSDLRGVFFSEGINFREKKGMNVSREVLGGEKLWCGGCDVVLWWMTFQKGTLLVWRLNQFAHWFKLPVMFAILNFMRPRVWV